MMLQEKLAHFEEHGWMIIAEKITETETMYYAALGQKCMYLGKGEKLPEVKVKAA